MSTYFGADSSRFWAMFLGRQPATCPIDDADEWSRWFQGLLGTPPAPLTLSDGDKELQQQLLSSKAQPTSAFESLNSMFCPDLTDGDDCCVNEVGGCLAELPHRKAADLQGLTCELLSAGASPVSVEGESDAQQFACRPLVECVAFILQHIAVQTPASSAQPHLPPLLQTSKVAPVPKSNQAAAPLDKDRYRSICVNSICTRCLRG